MILICKEGHAMIDHNSRQDIFGFIAVLGLFLAVILAPSVSTARAAGATTAPSRSTNSRSAAPRPGASQESTIYTIKEAGIQFDIPKGWKVDMDKDTRNVVLSIEGGAVTITFVVEDQYADVVTGMKDGLKEKLADMKSDGAPKEDTHNGMTHISESGAGMIKDQPVGWSIDVLKATKNVTILTFGITKIMEAHGEEYGKWVMSIKKI
jgi:hypothetical protein